MAAALFWVFGPLTLLVVTILVVAFLAFTDEVPIKDFSSITKAGEVRSPSMSAFSVEP